MQTEKNNCYSISIFFNARVLSAFTSRWDKILLYVIGPPSHEKYSSPPRSAVWLPCLLQQSFPHSCSAPLSATLLCTSLLCRWLPCLFQQSYLPSYTALLCPTLHWRLQHSDNSPNSPNFPNSPPHSSLRWDWQVKIETKSGHLRIPWTSESSR